MMCRRLGAKTALTVRRPRPLILEEYFLPLEHSAGQVLASEINRELGIWAMLDARDLEGLTQAETVPAGGTARDRVLAMIDDCEWRLAYAEAGRKDTSFVPYADDLRRRLGMGAAVS